MKMLIFLFLFLALASCHGQHRNVPAAPDTVSGVGGGCDGCELMYVGMPSHLASTDTSEGWKEPGRKLVLKGRVLRGDGITPAGDVILYYWQTDRRGYYSPGPGMPKEAARHGHIRGWVKTNADGAYSIYTCSPSPYPGENIPAHIHFAVKEPGLNEYYIDDVMFDDDPLLTVAERKKLDSRGGSGIVRMEVVGSNGEAQRDIILGLNIPGHPHRVRH